MEFESYPKVKESNADVMIIGKGRIYLSSFSTARRASFTRLTTVHHLQIQIDHIVL